jgi:hypothetical protein
LPHLVYQLTHVAFLLFPVLLFTGFISVLTLGFLIFLFLLHRLYIHMLEATSTEDGIEPSYEKISHGLSAWVDETGSRVDLSLLQRENIAQLAQALSEKARYQPSDKDLEEKPDIASPFLATIYRQPSEPPQSYKRTSDEPGTAHMPLVDEDNEQTPRSK